MLENARPSETIFESPVREVNNPIQGQSYEYPVAPPSIPEPPRAAPPKPVPYKDHKTGVSDTVSQQNDNASSIVEHDGMVMMDPGRFRLGDDDIY